METLVLGDKHLLALGAYRGIRIKVEEILTLLKEERAAN
jgi:hypothetical protein